MYHGSAVCVVLKVLIQAGALVNKADGDGHTALMHAAAKEKLDAVITLLNSGQVCYSLFAYTSHNHQHTHRSIPISMLQAVRLHCRLLRVEVPSTYAQYV